jgi:hypothetical protein
MTAQTYAALFGALYLILGIAGFVPPLWERVPAGAPPMQVTVFYASLFGIFTVNIILSMMHLVIGLWGVMAANSRYPALVFARGSTVLFLLLGIAGLIPRGPVKTLWGTAPLHGYNAWLYLATALVALFFALRPGYHLTQVGLEREMNPHRPAE